MPLRLRLHLTVGGAVSACHGLRLPSGTTFCHVQRGLPGSHGGDLGGLGVRVWGCGYWASLRLLILPCCSEGCSGVQAPSALPCIAQRPAINRKMMVLMNIEVASAHDWKTSKTFALHLSKQVGITTEACAPRSSRGVLS